MAAIQRRIPLQYAIFMTRHGDVLRPGSATAPRHDGAARICPVRLFSYVQKDCNISLKAIASGN
jgi:hypothetical protein